jgi:hypothetical protein
MDKLDQLIFNHLFAAHCVQAVIVIFLSRVDAVIRFLLRYFTPADLDKALDAVDAAAKARIDADAK